MSILEVIAGIPGFRQPGRARHDLEAIAKGLRPETLRQIESLLTVSPDPDRVVHGMATLKREKPAAFEAIAASPSGPQHMMAVFAWSRFLTEEVIQHPDWLQTLPDLQRVRSTEEYVAELEKTLAGAESGPPDMLVFAQFRRRAILRILICDVLGLATLSETTEQLSNLAGAILEVSFRRIRDALIRRHGTPRCHDQHGVLRECGFAVIALGKLGGRELNYSSDIDLMFVYTANGETDGKHPISNKEFYKKVGNQYTEMLSTYTVEGMCYRVDLRLRPDGSLGEICISLDGAKSYYQQRARDWELQMLIKARVAAGDRATGEALLDDTAPLTYASSLDFSAVEAVSATRLRIGEKLAARRPGKTGFDIKLAPGGIRDIEFLVQCLQRLHGGREPWVQQGGTLLALSRLNDKGLLSAAEYGRLAAAYSFLRHLEHRLQFEDDRQTHTLPTDSEELEALARRMPHEPGVDPSGDNLASTLNGHLKAVEEIYERVIHAQQPMYYATVAEPAEPELLSEDALAEPVASNVVRFLDQRAPALARLLSRYPMKRGARMFEHFLERVIANSEWLPELDREPALARDVLDIFENSPYFADELIRAPDLLHALANLEERPADDLDDLADTVSLRRFFRREMFRIEAESICRRVWVFSTLERTSALADAILGAAYRLAVRQTLDTHPPIQAGYLPSNQMTLIALGRLGMYEFDVSSDADLLFVIPDRDSAEQIFWTRVAERIIDILTAYTGEGTLLAVDTRLRPNGSSGALVQTDHSCLDYFARGAEAWEGIAYMKSRTVAGDLDAGTAFLHRLQDVDWRRYGQSGRSRQSLRNMRARVEKEQGSTNPLKAGLGGYYDIDFILMYLRLKAAGLFFKVLNTPERIDVIEKTGHLDRADAEFLRDAATFYRAVDHGLRVYTGHAEGNLPGSTTQMECLTELVHRWAPEHMCRQPITAQLAQIKGRTRETFDRLFV
ncbi:MAG: glutamine-synthetase adenylyltransferase [Bryobacteraceae bacterium]|jgi:glutamate-ammonia-ligase adenylyltransferase